MAWMVQKTVFAWACLAGAGCRWQVQAFVERSPTGAVADAENLNKAPDLASSLQSLVRASRSKGFHDPLKVVAALMLARYAQAFNPSDPVRRLPIAETHPMTLARPRYLKHRVPASSPDVHNSGRVPISVHMTSPEITTKCFFDVSIDGSPAGRIVMGLYGKIVPITVENFRALCTGEKGVGITGNPLHYRGSIFHRVIPNMMMQGGDVSYFDGSGSESIYGTNFDDENFDISHTKRGLLSMASSSPHMNGSQFFVTLEAYPEFDGKHVVFGEVIDGLEVLSRVEAQGTPQGLVKKRVTIDQCGELK